MAKTITFQDDFETITFENESKSIVLKDDSDSITFDILQSIGIGVMIIEDTFIVG